ncbi:hypothetical protein GW869_01860 [bacterium]|nr:hypothetical protein [bacterium]NCS32749.1 hypothetical protein [bacterium]
MERKRLSKSICKYIRQEKAQIRREVLDIKEQEKLISELYKRFFKNYEDKRNIQTGNK